MHLSSSARLSRGFTLVEAMVSMAVLSIGTLGIMQVQVLASQQNSVARKASLAAAVAQDFVEQTMRRRYEDLAALGKGCNMELTTNFPLTEISLGSQKTPKYAPDLNESNRGANYDGAFTALPSEFQLVWSVREMDTSPPYTGACRAVIINGAVRFPSTAGRYRNHIVQFTRYNPAIINPGGIPEVI